MWWQGSKTELLRLLTGDTLSLTLPSLLRHLTGNTLSLLLSPPPRSSGTLQLILSLSLSLTLPSLLPPSSSLTIRSFLPQSPSLLRSLLSYLHPPPSYRHPPLSYSPLSLTSISPLSLSCHTLLLFLVPLSSPSPTSLSWSLSYPPFICNYPPLLPPLFPSPTSPFLPFHLLSPLW